MTLMQFENSVRYFNFKTQELAPELTGAEAFLDYLLGLTFPENLLLFHGPAPLPLNPISTRPIPGIASIRFTQEVRSWPQFAFRLQHAELLFPLAFTEKWLTPTQSPRSWNVYFARHGSPGLLSPHHDTHDVLVLQIFGRKLWRINGEEKWLSPGDAVSIPAGVEHCVLRTEGDALHVSVGTHTPNAHQALRGFLDQYRSHPLMLQKVEDKVKFEAALLKAIQNFLGDSV